MAKKLSKKVVEPASVPVEAVVDVVAETPVVEADAVVMASLPVVVTEDVDIIPDGIPVAEGVLVTKASPGRVSRVQADIRKYGRA